jgi:hypothetical protein
MQRCLTSNLHLPHPSTLPLWRCSQIVRRDVPATSINARSASQRYKLVPVKGTPANSSGQPDLVGGGFRLPLFRALVKRPFLLT